MDQIKKIILSLNLLKDVERNRSFKGLEKYNVIFITIVTPIQNNRNINLKNLLNLINQLKNKIESNTILVLKSTVKIGTTDIINQRLNRKKIFLAMCPEITTEGSALKEIYYLPQIIGCDDIFVYCKKRKITV